MRHPPPNLEPVVEEELEIITSFSVEGSGGGSGSGGEGSNSSNHDEEEYTCYKLQAQAARDSRRKEMWKRKLLDHHTSSPEEKRKRERRAEERLSRLMALSFASPASVGAA